MEEQAVVKPVADNGGADEDEWEYEYHETETETFHVTLDLSSFDPHVRAKHAAAAQPSKAEAKPAAEASNQAENMANGTTSAPDGHLAKEEAVFGTVELHDLHTTNPTVRYRGQLYSCSWGTTIGTDVIFRTSRAEPTVPPSQRAVNGDNQQRPQDSDDAPPTPAPAPASTLTPVASVRGPSEARTSAPQSSSNTHQQGQQTGTAAIEAITNIKLLARPLVPVTTRLPGGGSSRSAKGKGSAGRSITDAPLTARDRQVDFLRRLQGVKRAKGEADAGNRLWRWEKKETGRTAKRKRKKKGDSDDDDDDDGDEDGVYGSDNGDDDEGQGEEDGDVPKKKKAKQQEDAEVPEVQGTRRSGRKRPPPRVLYEDEE